VVFFEGLIRLLTVEFGDFNKGKIDAFVKSRHSGENRSPEPSQVIE